MLDREGWSMDEKDHPGQYAAQAALQPATVAVRTRAAAPMESVTWQGRPWPTYDVNHITTASIPDWARQPGTEGKICKTFGALSDKGRRRSPPMPCSRPGPRACCMATPRRAIIR
jgi:hypothetical protein